MDIVDETSFRVAYTSVIQSFGRANGYSFEKASGIVYFGYQCCSSADHFENEMKIQGHLKGVGNENY